MDDQKYTEKDIKWALGELQKKYPNAIREQAIKYLDTLGSLGGLYLNNLKEGKKQKNVKNSKAKKLSAEG